jgi:hypothetical protein
MSGLMALAYASHVDAGFYTKLVQVANDVGMRPEDILSVMTYESGIDPTAKNPAGAYGLIQFEPNTLKGVGFQGSPEEFRHLSATQQLDYVKKLIANRTRYNGRPFESAAQYYVANFVPVALKLPGIRSGDPSTILAAKNPTTAHLPGVSIAGERAIYAENANLDVDHDNAITYGDIQKVMLGASKRDTYKNAVSEMHRETGYTPSARSAEPTEIASQQAKPDIETILNQFLSALSSNESHYLKKKAIKQLLPNQYRLVIKASKPKAAEFARVLCQAIDQSLCEDASIHSDGHSVEVQATIHGDSRLCTAALLELSNILASAFDVKVAIHPRSNSIYQEQTLTAALTNYNLFRTS